MIVYDLSMMVSVSTYRASFSLFLIREGLLGVCE